MAKRINISFDSKSIENAIKQLETIKKKMQGEIPRKFLERCVYKIQDYANQNLDNASSSFDPAIINGIKSSWTPPIFVGDNLVRLENINDKAVFLEFGVGIIGEQNSHDNASATNYQYNVDSGKKTKNGYWRFRVDDGRAIDLDINHYKRYDSGKDKSQQWVVTQGSPSLSYLFNAIMRMKEENQYKTIWNKVLEESL